MVPTHPEFTPFPKIPRLLRDVVITEKIDGTNAAIGVLENGKIYAQSRKRLITPLDDNFGFARWAEANAGTLAADLGPGLHFGEWWGSGIQRGYGLLNGEKRFSLFNTDRWGDEPFTTPGVAVVPVLNAGPFDTEVLLDVVEDLARSGSSAAPGFPHPEGVVVWHTAARAAFKVTLLNDEKPKAAA